MDLGFPESRTRPELAYQETSRNDQILLIFKGIIERIQTKVTIELFITQSRFLMTFAKKPFENMEGKGENAGNQHFILFPPCFQPYQRQKSSFNYFHFVACKCLQFGPVTW